MVRKARPRTQQVIVVEISGTSTKRKSKSPRARRTTKRAKSRRR